MTLRRLLFPLLLLGLMAALLSACTSESDRLYRRAKDAASEDNDYEAAIRYIDQAIALNPSEGRYHRRRGDWLRELDRGDEALESYRRATEAEVVSESAFGKAISLCLELGRYDAAQEWIDRARSTVTEADVLEKVEELAQELAQLRSQPPVPASPEVAGTVTAAPASPAP